MRLARRVRDRALALTEFTLAVARLTKQARAGRCVSGRPDMSLAVMLPYRRGLRRVRRAVRADARVALVTRAGDTIHVLLEGRFPVDTPEV